MAAARFAGAFFGETVFAAALFAWGGLADESGTTVSTVQPDGTLYGEGQA